MDEDIAIIDTNTRNERIKNFFFHNRKKIIIVISIIAILLIGFFSFQEIKKKNKIKIANKFNAVTIDYDSEEKGRATEVLIGIINEKDETYSPLALYFLIDNSLIESVEKCNKLFDILIDKTNLAKEIRNLVIYKKALYNSDSATENELIQILNPLINSESIWKSHALYLMAEYFYSKNEKQKSKDFFNQILTLPEANPDIVLETKKRINRDLSE
jgi:predicted RND superfamily exporter protein